MYIDVDKLKEVIKDEIVRNKARFLNIINSLQQELDLIVINKKDWEAQEQFRKNKDFGKPLQQEQPEVDLEDGLDKFYKELDFGPSEAIEYETHKQIARHFYELGLNARKEE